MRKKHDPPSESDNAHRQTGQSATRTRSAKTQGGAIINVSKFDASEYIESEEDAIAYLNAAAETGDPSLLQAAIGDIAKARGMGQIAKKAGVGRESLYKSLDKEGNPSFRTIVKVVNALGGRLVIEPAPVTA